MSKRGRWYRKPMPEGVTQEQLNLPQFKGCEIKIPFVSKDAADDAILKAGRSKSGYLRGTSYKCNYCPNWHITSKKSASTKSNKKEG